MIESALTKAVERHEQADEALQALLEQRADAARIARARTRLVASENTLRRLRRAQAEAEQHRRAEAA